MLSKQTIVIVRKAGIILRGPSVPEQEPVYTRDLVNSLMFQALHMFVLETGDGVWLQCQEVSGG